MNIAHESYPTCTCTYFVAPPSPTLSYAVIGAPPGTPTAPKGSLARNNVSKGYPTPRKVKSPTEVTRPRCICTHILSWIFHRLGAIFSIFVKSKYLWVFHIFYLGFLLLITMTILNIFDLGLLITIFVIFRTYWVNLQSITEILSFVNDGEKYFIHFRKCNRE